MNSLVLDGSAALGFLLEDEQPPQALAALKAIEKGERIYVPSHWWLETANGLIFSERRGRVSQEKITEALRALYAIPVVADDETASRCGADTFALARQYGLTIYDSAYLELAMRRRSVLATLDRALARAATAAGVEVLD